MNIQELGIMDSLFILIGINIDLDLFFYLKKIYQKLRLEYQTKLTEHLVVRNTKFLNNLVRYETPKIPIITNSEYRIGRKTKYGNSREILGGFHSTQQYIQHKIPEFSNLRTKDWPLFEGK